MLISFLSVFNFSYAANVNSAHIYEVNDCGKLLTYKGIVVKATYVEYLENGIHYPAYCMDKTKDGAEKGAYTVSVNGAVKDVNLWRIIINGYPYKSLQELGVETKEEAFTATKQSIYCYIHGNKFEDHKGIGEAGNRTLNAMKKIMDAANNSKESKISSTITINKVSTQWQQDNIERGYASKTYSVTAGAKISNYKVSITKNNSQELGGIKLTDMQNKEKSEFSPNEKFKILIPIKNLTSEGTIGLKVSAEVETKPVLYGTAPDTNKQDYALTAATFEDGIGETKDEYYKNETKIIIIKKDQQSGKFLSGVEFELLDKNKNVVYSDLKTDENGQIIIENLVPGEYYIRETKTIEGYQIYNQLIKAETKMNQELTVTVNNSKEDIPNIETKTQTSKNISNQEIKKLPVTGM